MKTVLLTALMLITISGAFAQEPADALRYSWTTQSGTARNQAIGGASASLGGEFSTIFNNPAGLAFYKTDELVLTPGYNMQKFNSVYRSSLSNSRKNNFQIGASGLVFAMPSSYNKDKIRNVTFALGVNRSADFNSDIYYKGMNNKSSYSEKYLEELINDNVTDPNNAANNYPFGSSLALNTYLIDTTKGANGTVTGYKSLATVGTGLIQEAHVKSNGGITDLALAGSVNYMDKLYFGGTISVPFLYYNRTSQFRETDATSSTTNHFNYFESNETLKTMGVGVNGKFGVIYKPREYIRLGLAVHTPTWFQSTDKYTAEIVTDLEGYGGAGVKKQSSNDFTGNEPGKNKYNLVTPWRAMISGSYVFREVENTKKQRAFITADIEYVNYKAAGFGTSDGDASVASYYKTINGVIDQQYKGNFNFRLGGELKYHTIMARLGGAYYGNPYKNEKANKVKLSGGLGYRDHGIFVDLTYVYSMGKDANYPYRLDSKANEAASIKSKSGNVVLTLGFKI